MNGIRHFLRDPRGASAAEFALVLPLFLLFLLGIIDAGRFMWEHNRAEKATQMGTRYAVVTETVLGDGFETYSFVTGDGILAGDPVPSTSFESATCDTNSCTCTGGAVCGSIVYDSAAFDAIVARMAAFYPPITDQNVTIEYRNVGFGFAGDPNGPDVAPLVTVRLSGLTFQPITTMLFGGALTMPSFAAALTLEDGSGTASN